MISPNIYRKQIDDLEIEGMMVIAENAEEAHNLLDELETMEKMLDRIRVNVRMDIRAIRREYLEKIKNAEKSAHTKDKSKIKEKKFLVIERGLKLASYESIEDTIEDYLFQIKNANVYLKSVIREYEE